MPPPKNYKIFSFDSYEIELKKNRIIFHYSVDGEIFFDPILELDLSKVKNVEQIQAAVFNLGMAEIPSFYKTVCTPKIKIKAGPLSKQQIKFWEELYISGLGEFFFRNKIDFRNLCKIEATNSRTPLTINSGKELPEKYLVPIGGGKDSIVSAEILKEKGVDFTWFMLEPWPVCGRVIKESGNPKKIEIYRDPEKYFAKVIELNQKGFYNGHVPISAVYIFSAVLAAKINGFTHIVLSNERSANIGNTTYLGREINHQFSKSWAFEQACHDYIKKNIDPQIYFFSLLRDKYEIQITEKFVQYPKYFSTFLSCNKGLKKDTGWCCKCAKCVFVFIMLSAFLEQKNVTQIFGKNLFEDKSLLPLFQELLGLKNIKPWDCVGTVEEVYLALYLAKQSMAKRSSAFPNAQQKLPIILKELDVEKGREYLHLLKDLNDENLIPKNLISRKFAKKYTEVKAKNAVNKPRIAIAGFGEEGQALYEYFKKTNEVHVFNEQSEPQPKLPHSPIFHDTLKIPSNFPVVYKSPGIPLNKLKLTSAKTEISSLTNLFFQNAKGIIVGVTGTKGKSTTASLIYHILKDAGFDTVLMGNIGQKGSLDFLKTDHENRIYVYELSSFQLELLNHSPHIAVVTSLYPDHLDHHHTFAAYAKAKQNIVKFQKSADFLVINSEIDSKYFKTKAQKYIISADKNFKCKTKLVGQHNKNNILMAYAVARIFDIPKNLIIKSISTFNPLPGRLEKVATVKGKYGPITFYDDALATIPQATWKAIQALPQVDTIILGGQDRGISFEEFAHQLTTTKIKNFIIFPDTGKKMVKYLQKDRNILTAKNMQQAVVLAKQYTKKACLLSTASPSFNMFKNYKDRSEQYKFWINKH